MHVSVGTCMMWCPRGGQKPNFKCQFTPSTMWVLDVKLKSADLGDKCFDPLRI